MQYKRFIGNVRARHCASSVKIWFLLLLFSLVIAGCDASPDTSQGLSGNDWPMLGHDISYSSTNNETILSPSNIGQLNKLWSFKTGDVIAATATVVGNTVFIGSWDGYEYAINTQSGTLIWKTFLGKTVGYNWCNPPKLGITSTPTYDNGTLYLGGGDSYWYALDAKTGHVQWKIFTGDNSATAGYYNWSSPVIYQGYAYVGTASLGDCPLALGQLLKVSLKDHKIAQQIDLVPKDQVGAGIWSPLTIDQATNEMYLTTGTENALTQVNAQSLLAIDLNTFTIKDLWHVPEENAIIDSDFGSGPTLFQTSNGTHMVMSINKNGIAYAFNTSHLSAGPVWQNYIAEGGLGPEEGGGSISTGVFANHTVYMAGGNNLVNNVGYQGAVRALNPDDGKVLWIHKTSGPILGALTYSNGMLFADAGNVLEVLNPKDGTRIGGYTLNMQIYDTPVISHGQVFVGDTDGSLYALGIPGSPQATPSTKCGNLTCWDIANTSNPATTTFSNGTWNVTTSGFGMNISSDQLQFAAQPVSGDTQISARITSLQGPNSAAQAGLMLRQSADPGAPFYGVFVRNDHTVVVLDRATPFGGVDTQGVTRAPTTASLPIYLQIQRVDDRFIAATSTDGVHYTGVPGSTQTLALLTKQLAGPATASGDDQATATATYQNLTISAPTVVPDETPPSTPCMADWECTSIGYPALVGTQKANGQNFTIGGAGIDIDGYADQFHFVSQQITQDGTISARLLSQTRTDPWAKAGLMIRQGKDDNAPFYAVLFTPDNGLLLEYRYGKGLSAEMTNIPLNTAPTLPFYLKIARAGNIFSAYQSTDGANWTFILGTNVQMDLSGPMQVGLAVTSTNWENLGTATFDSVQMANQAPPPTVLCPKTWMCGDVGFPKSMLPGTQIYNNGGWLLQGAGDEIAHTLDTFHAVWQTLTNNGSVGARIVSMDPTDPYTKAGVMLRVGIDPGSPFYALLTTQKDGLVLAYRDKQGGDATVMDIGLDSQNYLPISLKVTRVGNTFDAFYSQDGVNWTEAQDGGQTLDMPNKLFAGLVINSNTTLQEATANFDTISIG